MTDAQALARFEALVLNQEPAKPWAAVTDYSFAARSAIEGQHPDLLIKTFGMGPYLDYGCGPDAILVRLLRDRGALAYGIDPLLKEEWRCFQPKWDSIDEEFTGAAPVVICREVFEHMPLRDIPPLIRRWKRRFAERFVYVTTRFHLAPQHLLDVMTADDLDPTHITMMNQTLLRALFVLEGFKRRADLEERLDWQHKGRVLVYERAA